MAFYFEPHSVEWFQALDAFNPVQAAITREAIMYSGREDICSICADIPSSDYQLIDPFMEENAVATIRLCGDCLNIKTKIHKENYIPYKLITK